MRKAAERFSAPLLALLVTASLVFGASAAFAQPQERVCRKNPPYEQGSCLTFGHCEIKCEDIGNAYCTSEGCCLCV